MKARICLKCGHEFGAADPDPCWCPLCGKLSSLQDLPDETVPNEPDEIAESATERMKWRVWFWILFLLGPLLSLLMLSLAQGGVGRLPAWMKTFVVSSANPFVAVVAAATGAGFCLAKLWVPRRPLVGQLFFAFAMGIVLCFVYAGILLFGCFLMFGLGR